MAKRYIAIGIDGDGDVVASSVGCDVEATAVAARFEFRQD